jgi:hypothetical protein
LKKGNKKMYAYNEKEREAKTLEMMEQEIIGSLHYPMSYYIRWLVREELIQNIS